MKKKMFSFGLILLAFSFIFVGCEKSNAHQVKEIAVCISMPNSGFWEDAYADISHLGESFHFKILDARANDGAVNHEQQKAAVEKCIQEGAEYLILGAVNTTKAPEIVKLAKEAGVKVIVFDRSISSPLVDLQIMADSFSVGQMLASTILELVPRGNYLVLKGDRMDSNTPPLYQGSMSVLRSQKGIKIVGDEFIDGWTADSAYEKTIKYLNEGIRLNAIICPSDVPVPGVLKALKEKNLLGRVKVSGQDGLKSSVEFIEKGQQAFTVYKDIHLFCLSAVNAILLYEKELIPFYNRNVRIKGTNVKTHFIDAVVIDNNRWGNNNLEILKTKYGMN